MRAAYLFESDWAQWSQVEAMTAFGRLADTGITAVMSETDRSTPQIVDYAQSAGLSWIAAYPCFSDHLNENALNRGHPEFAPITVDGLTRPQMEWYVGLSPASAELRAQRLEGIISLVAGAGIDGLVLDFVRWPLHWEMEIRAGSMVSAGSFDDKALAGFADWLGAPVQGGTAQERRDWIQNTAVDEWNEYRCAVVEGFVRDVVSAVRLYRPDLTIGATIVPLGASELRNAVGQDVGRLARHVDWIMPMMYHAIIHEQPSWVGRLLREFESAAPGQVVPILQCDSTRGAEFDADWGAPISVSEREVVIAEASQATSSSSVVLFPGSVYL